MLKIYQDQLVDMETAILTLSVLKRSIEIKKIKSEC